MNLLTTGLERLGIPFSQPQIEKIVLYTKELSLWNRKLSLVSAEGEVLVIRHLLDSLSALRYLEELPGREIADAGSGGGFPGIPLALFLPDRKFFLIERSEKKAVFLSSCALLMELSNLEIISKPLEEVTRDFEIVVFRALGQWSRYQKVLYNLTSPGGYLLAYKGRREILVQEIETAERYFSDPRIIPLDVPFLGEERNIVIFKRDAGDGGRISS